MVVDNILNVVFPRFCLGCGYIGSYICPACEKKLKHRKDQERCFYCKKKSYLGLTHPKCKRRRGVDGYVFLYLYTGLFKKIIHSVKYGGAYKILNEMSLFETESPLRTLLKWNSLLRLRCQAVPLHIEKQKERGFNQVEHILRPISLLLNAETLNILTKIKKTKSQASLQTRGARQKNIKGSFALTASHVPENILLVDDVVTTGFTAKECVRVLRKGGAKNVFVFSLARG